MKLFKVVYMIEGQYKQKYIGQVVSWENGIIKFRDKDLKIRHLKEKYIVKIEPVLPMKKNIPVFRREEVNYQQTEIYDYL